MNLRTPKNMDGRATYGDGGVYVEELAVEWSRERSFAMRNANQENFRGEGKNHKDASRRGGGLAVSQQNTCFVQKGPNQTEEKKEEEEEYHQS